MGEIHYPPVLDLEIHDHCRSAEARMRLSAGVRRGKAAEPRNIRGELQNLLAIDVVDHAQNADEERRPAYIGAEKPEIESWRPVPVRAPPG